MADRELYFKFRDPLDAFAKAYHRMEVQGLENVPERGGALVCPNHENYTDPFFLGAAIPHRMLHFLAWHGIMDMPVIGPLVKRVGHVHPIMESYGVALDRDNARQALSGFAELLREDKLCVIFPTGEIRHWIDPGRFRHFKPGAVRMAAGAGVPIIPAALTGTRWALPNVINFHDFDGPDKGFWAPIPIPVKIKVRFGKPFIPDPLCAGDPLVRDRETQRLRRTIVDLIETM